MWFLLTIILHIKTSQIDILYIFEKLSLYIPHFVQKKHDIRLI